MSIFKKKKPLPIPPPYTPKDIKIESSICTGERVIGFYDKTAKRLCYSELVRDDSDIAEFYKKYGLEPRTI